MPLTSLAIVVVIGLALAAAPAAAAEGGLPTDNLLQNGDFSATDPGGGPTGWVLARDAATVDAVLALDEGPEGCRAARLTCTRIERVNPASHAMLAQMGTARLQAGKWYRLSFWARQEGLASRGVDAAIQDTDGWHNCGLQTRFRLGREWRLCTHVFRATRTVGETSRFQIWHQDTGTFWVADIALVECPAPETECRPALPPSPGRNLVPNASFEAGAGGWGSTADISIWGSRGLNFRFGDRVTETAADGRASFRIALTPQNTPVFSFDYYQMVHVPIRAPLVANEGWIRLEPGKPYTLSAAMKADRPGIIGVLSLRGPWGGGASQKVTLTTSWQRYSATFTASERWGYVAVGPDLGASGTETATVWVDALQLEQGPTAGPFAPAASCEATFDVGRAGYLVPAGKPVAIEVGVCCAGLAAVPFAVRWRATDFWDREAASGSARIVAPAGGAARRVLRIRLPRPGFYRLHLSAEGGGRTYAREIRVALLERVPTGDSHFGMNHAYGWPQLLDACRRIGLHWMRDWSIKWGHVQPAPGPFDWREADHQIGRVLQHGLSVLGLLPFPSAEWAAEDPPRFVPEPEHEGLGRVPLAPKDPEALAAYVEATVRRYRDRIRHWEIFNEPVYTGYALPQRAGYTVKDYVRLLAVAARAARKADPKCVIVGGIGGGPDTLTRELIAEGGLQHLDVLNLHTYPGDAPPESFEGPMAALRERLRGAGRGDIPIWLTEYAYYADDDPPVTPTRQWMTALESERECGEYLVKFAAIMLGHGVDKIFYHAGTCGTLNLDQMEGIFFEYGGAPRKMLAAQAALARMLPASRRFLRVVRLHSRAMGYLFGDARGKTMVVWARGDLTPLALRLADPRLRALDIMGAPIAARQRRLDETPLYVTAPPDVSAGAFADGVSVTEQP